MSGPSAPSSSYNAVDAGRRKHEEFEIQRIIPLSTMKELRSVYRSSPILEQVRSLMQKSVWSAGLGFFKECIEKNEGRFSKKGHRVEWNPPSFVKMAIERHWQKFKHDVLDSLFMYGFVTVHYQLPETAGEPIVDERERKYPFPTVVPCELYRLMVRTSLTGGTKLVALHNRHETELPDTVVYADYGFNPTCDGNITSLVAKAYPDVLFLQEHARAQLRIKSIRCNPTVVIESSAAVRDEASGSKSAARKAFVGNIGESAGIAPADNVTATSVTSGAVPFSVNVDPRAAVDRDNLILRRARRAAALRRGDLRAASMIHIPEDVLGGDRPLNTAAGITLDEGETARFMPIPTESTDFTITRQTITESIAGVFGVPISVLMGSALSGHGRGGVTESNSRIVHSMFRLTVSEWRQRLADVLTLAFQEAYFELLVSAPVNRSSKASDGGAAKNGGAVDAYMEKRKRMIHIDFNPTTFIDNYELRELYVWGIIDFDTFSRFAMSNASLPLSDRVKHPPKHPLGLGYEDNAQQAKQDAQAKPVSAPKPAGGDARSKTKHQKKSQKSSDSGSSTGTKRKDPPEETEKKTDASSVKKTKS